MKPLVFLLLLAPLSLRADDAEIFPPQSIPADRYEAMTQRSPFVLPTDEEPAVVATWASDFQIVSILKRGEAFVVLAKKVSTGERMPIRTEPNPQGLRLVTLQMSPDPREVSAVIALGDAEGTITYDPALLAQMPHPSASGNPALKSE
ncbi:MAG TPA: hypothetical protein VNQ90_09415 [Chthoniobacteraceae bacterium]|nr:hypothetical protein [Chthoniobacteraceae bacterium]